MLLQCPSTKKLHYFADIADIPDGYIFQQVKSYRVTINGRHQWTQVAESENEAKKLVIVNHFHGKEIFSVTAYEMMGD